MKNLIKITMGLLVAAMAAGCSAFGEDCVAVCGGGEVKIIMKPTTVLHLRASEIPAIKQIGFTASCAIVILLKEILSM